MASEIDSTVTTSTKRTVLYQRVLKMWSSKQVTMITEESAELTKELSRLNKLIAKLIRADPKGYILPEQLITRKKFQLKLKPRLVDEVVDIILILDQFTDDFLVQVLRRFDEKFERLEERVKQNERNN